MIPISYLMKRKIKRIFLEVISNTKIFNIKILFNEISKDQDFAKLTGSLLDKWELDNVEYGNSVIIKMRINIKIVLKDIKFEKSKYKITLQNN